MKNSLGLLAALLLLSACSSKTPSENSWVIDSNREWQSAMATSSGLKIEEGRAEPTAEASIFSSIIKKFPIKKKATELIFRQSPEWRNWQAVPSVGPKKSLNAPVFLPVKDKDYWYFAQHWGKKGYHAWHSTDMKKWVHKGQVSKSRWMTTAEYADGRFYLYYDEPNDEDPHLIVDSDLTDGKFDETGMVFNDPSHGSDAGVLRDEDGTFHLIYEDWSPINASQHSWDSPLAGHADSPDGIHGFQPHENPPVIDTRTKPTGKYGTYYHVTNHLNYKYEIHEGEQDAFGDYTLIKVGSQYYIFCDYDSHKQSIRVGCWTSDSINKQFSWAGEIGEDLHPDPTIGFAEGQFYLIVQKRKGVNKDYISSGPWVSGVKARAGVDVDGDDKIDHWTKWQPVSEKYSKKKGFAQVVERTPASLDMSSLPAGYGFKFELTMDKMAGNNVMAVMDSIKVSFK